MGDTQNGRANRQDMLALMEAARRFARHSMEIEKGFRLRLESLDGNCAFYFVKGPGQDAHEVAGVAEDLGPLRPKEAPAAWEFFSQLEKDIIAFLRDRDWTTGAVIAAELGMQASSPFSTLCCLLANLVDRCVLQSHRRNGYKLTV